MQICHIVLFRLWRISNESHLHLPAGQADDKRRHDRACAQGGFAPPWTQPFRIVVFFALHNR